MEAMLVLCTVPDEEAGLRLARGLVEGRLAACVNLVPGVRSLYRWEGEVQDDREVQLVVKTRADRYDDVEAYLRSAHPYDEPEVLAIAAARGSASYLAWIARAADGDA